MIGDQPDEACRLSDLIDEIDRILEQAPSPRSVTKINVRRGRGRILTPSLARNIFDRVVAQGPPEVSLPDFHDLLRFVLADLRELKWAVTRASSTVRSKAHVNATETLLWSGPIVLQMISVLLRPEMWKRRTGPAFDDLLHLLTDSLRLQPPPIHSLLPGLRMTPAESAEEERDVKLELAQRRPFRVASAAIATETLTLHLDSRRHTPVPALRKASHLLAGVPDGSPIPWRLPFILRRIESTLPQVLFLALMSRPLEMHDARLKWGQFEDVICGVGPRAERWRPGSR